LIQVHGAAGVHPLVKVMLETSRSAAHHAAQLGLTPARARSAFTGSVDLVGQSAR
jgi:hypothetical protein